MVASHSHPVDHHHSFHASESYKRTSDTVHSIEKDLGSNHGDKVNSETRNKIYGELDKLRKTDGKNFDEDLKEVNARLQHDGYLPNLFLVENDSKHPGDASSAVGPTGTNGFHLSKTFYETPLAKKGQKVDQSAPAAAPLAPGEVSQGTWAQQNPSAPVGSTGGDGGYSGGSTPIGGSDVQSSPVDQTAPTLNASAGSTEGLQNNQQLVSEIQQALQLLNAQRAAEGLPPIADNQANETAILQIIAHESGGNANAQNNSDSNAAAGDPSRGLMQTIGTTFSSYHVKGTSNNIFDPVANIAAGVNYAVNRYGSLQNVPGVKALDSGGQYVGY